MLPKITGDMIMLGAPLKCDLSRNLGQCLLEQVAKRPRHSVFMVDSHTGAELTNQSLIEDTVTVAEWLRSENIGPGSRVGVCAENRLEFAVPLIGSLAIGATCAPLNPLYTIDELMHTMSISRPRVIFCSSSLTTKLSLALHKLDLPCKLVGFDDMPLNKTVISYKQMIMNKADVSKFRAEEINTEENVGVVLCSSGTTGLPKCVQLTHANLTCFVELMRNPNVTGELSDKDVLLGLPPFFHGYGYALLLASASIGMKIVSIAKFSELHFLETVQNYKVSLLFIVPPIAVLLAKHPLVGKYDLSSVKMVRCGAAPLSRDVQIAAKKRLNNVDFGQAYGMTEVSVACVFVPANSTKTGSVGVVTGGMECKIADPDTGKPLQAFKEGEVCFRGKFVMKGYMNNEKATAEMIDNQGWLHTGDIGYFDLQGYLYIVDRLKELIKYKGFQVPPAELEAVLLTHIGVKDTGVIGIPDEIAGELPFAFVVRQPTSNVTEEELKMFVASKVSAQKRLSGGIRFISEIPKNPSGKILRRELRAMYKKKTTSKL